MTEKECSGPPETGTFCWNELGTRDVPAAIKFYSELFGWTTTEMPMGEQGTYNIVFNNGKDLGGIYDMSCCGEMGEVPPHWLSYVWVDDVDASAAKAGELGASICVPPTDIPNVGRFSVITDPTGATFAIFKGNPNECGCKE